MKILSSLKASLRESQKDEKGTGKSGGAGRARVISFLNQKGGVGKTTLLFQLAFALKERGRKVLCIDMDPQANLGLLFGITEAKDREYNLFHLLINSVRELKVLHRPVLVNDVVKERMGIDVIPSGQELSGLELTVAGISALPRQLVLRRFLEKSGLLDQYDFILVDGPPTLGLLVVNIMCACHGILVPFRPDQFSRSGLTNLHETLEDVREMEISTVPEILGYIPNLVDSRRKQEEEDFSLIKNDAIGTRGKIFRPFANRVPMVKASAHGKSVFSYDSKEFKELQGQFLELAQEVEKRLM